MGKGARKRQHQAEKIDAHNRLCAEAKRYHRYTCALAIISVILLAVSMAVQLFAIHAVGISEQSDEVAAILSRAVPMGLLGVTLMSVGALTAVILLCTRKYKLSAIGVALMLIGVAFLAAFVAAMAECFPYKQIITNSMVVREQGLTFSKLFWRHGVAFLPPVLLLIAQGFGFAALKKSELAAMMDPAADVLSTLNLDD